MIAIDGLPRKYAGRTASILTKTRLWYEQAGIESTILVVNHSSQLEDLTHVLRANGALAPGVRLVNLLDHLPDQTTYQGPPLSHQIDEPGMRSIRDKAQEVYRLYDSEGVYRVYKRFDYEGRLLHRDEFHENRSRTRRDEFRPDGTLQRKTFMDSHTNLPRQDIFFRHDQTPMFNVWLAGAGTGDQAESSVQRITYFDDEGAPKRVGYSFDRLLHTCLDNFLGDRLTFVTVEARPLDELFLSYQRESVRKLFVLHNAHTQPPFDDVQNIRGSYQPLFAARTEADAIVFLTNTQRDEAEQKFGRQDNFRVVPHSAQEPEPTEGDKVERDPNLVIMMARLDQQKQVNHAISAFAQVVKKVPLARLEIYGKGPDQQKLKAQIATLGLEESVLLKGFTTNPGRTYESAAMCIMTSRYEGAPLTVLESLMRGCPVISYDLRYGPPDMITHGVNGFLVPYGNKRKMAARIVQVLTDDELRASLIDGTANVAETFNEGAFIARWSGLFNDLKGPVEPHEQPG